MFDFIETKVTQWLKLISQNWHFQEIAALITIIAAIIGFYRYIRGRRKGFKPEGQQAELERSYLKVLMRKIEAEEKKKTRGFLRSFYIPLAFIDPWYKKTGSSKLRWWKPKLIKFLMKLRHPIVIVKGSPGSGKSVAMLNFCLELVERELKREYPIYIPIIINLRDYGQILSPSEKTTGYSWVIEFLKKYLHQQEDLSPYGTNIAENLEQNLGLGRMIVIFDSLDELPREGYDQLCKNLTDFAYHYSRIPPSVGHNNFLFSCRTLECPDALERVGVEIQPFTLKNVKDFLSVKLSKKVVRRRMGELNDLYHRLPEEQQLHTNPFFLSLIYDFIINHEIEPIPESQSKLFTDFVQRSFARQASSTSEKALDLLELLAFYGTTIRSSGTGTPLQDLENKDPQLKQNIINVLNNKNHALHESIRYFVNVENNLTLNFIHHRFREYFTASHLKKMVTKEDLGVLDPYIEDVWWREIIVILSTMLPEGSKEDLVRRIISKTSTIAERSYIERLEIAILCVSQNIKSFEFYEKKGVLENLEEEIKNVLLSSQYKPCDKGFIVNGLKLLLSADLISIKDLSEILNDKEKYVRDLTLAALRNYPKKLDTYKIRIATILMDSALRLDFLGLLKYFSLINAHSIRSLTLYSWLTLLTLACLTIWVSPTALLTRKVLIHYQSEQTMASGYSWYLVLLSVVFSCSVWLAFDELRRIKVLTVLWKIVVSFKNIQNDLPSLRRLSTIEFWKNFCKGFVIFLVAYLIILAILGGIGFGAHYAYRLYLHLHEQNAVNTAYLSTIMEKKSYSNPHDHLKSLSEDHKIIDPNLFKEIEEFGITEQAIEATDKVIETISQDIEEVKRKELAIYINNALKETIKGYHNKSGLEEVEKIQRMQLQAIKNEIGLRKLRNEKIVRLLVILLPFIVIGTLIIFLWIRVLMPWIALRKQRDLDLKADRVDVLFKFASSNYQLPINRCYALKVLSRSDAPDLIEKLEQFAINEKVESVRNYSWEVINIIRNRQRRKRAK